MNFDGLEWIAQRPRLRVILMDENKSPGVISNQWFVYHFLCSHCSNFIFTLSSSSSFRRKLREINLSKIVLSFPSSRANLKFCDAKCTALWLEIRITRITRQKIEARHLEITGEQAKNKQILCFPGLSLTDNPIRAGLN